MEAGKIISLVVPSEQTCEISLKNFNKGVYQAIGVSPDGYISQPIEFGVSDGIPSVRICAEDSYTGEEVCCCLTINGITCPGIPAGGFTLSAMGDISLCMSYNGYCSVEKKVTVYTDTIFRFTMTKDSYLKVIQNGSNEPVPGATVLHNSKSLFTDDNGISRIQNLQDDSLTCCISKDGYFTETISVPLIPGETASVKMTPLRAKVNFVLTNSDNPVSGVNILLNTVEAITNENGQADFTNLESRNEYKFEINSICHEKTNGTFFLETDTTIRLTLHPGLSDKGMRVIPYGNLLFLKPQINGTFYIVPEGTVASLADVKNYSVWQQFVLAGDSVTTNFNYFPSGMQYWIYFAPEECGGAVLKRAHMVTDSRIVPINDVMIYPNPCRDQITIQFNGVQKYQIEMTSLQGKKLYQYEDTGTSHLINLSVFNSGIYFIRVKSKDLTTVKKIIKL